MMNQPAEMKKHANMDFHVHVLKEGGYVLSCATGEDYGYDTKEELLRGLSEELDGVDGGDSVDMKEKKEKKKNVRKIMGDADGENE